MQFNYSVPMSPLLLPGCASSLSESPFKMINRILIRIKVIQILYSFLLTENKFSIPEQGEQPTKERRFSYSLYLDMLYLLVRISKGITRRGGGMPLAETRFIKTIENDDKIRALAGKYRMSDFTLSPVVAELTDRLKESALYKNWLKSDNRDDQADTRFWRQVTDIIVLPDARLNSLFPSRENFALRGVDKMKDLLDETFTNFMGAQDNVEEALKTLSASLEKARELYFRLLDLPVAITDLHERDLEERRNKYIVDHGDLNPNLRMVENQLVASLRFNEVISSYVENNHISWRNEEPLLLQSLLKAILSSEVYKNYAELPATDYHTDTEFWRDVYKHVIFENDRFLESLEDKSVFWNDDVEIIGTFLLKTLRNFDEKEGNGKVLDKFKDEEDARFGKELMTYVWTNRAEYREMINSVLSQATWDAERLAFMDVVIVMTALAEILNFPKIPLSVTYNEYIELAKSYSTAKSGGFVNGLLGSIVKKLREEGKLFK